MQPKCEPYGDCTWSEAIVAWNTYILQNDNKTENPVKTMFENQMEIDIAKNIDISRFSTLTKLLGVTYRFLHALSWKPGKGHFATFMTKLKVVNVEQLELVKQFWIRDAQRSLIDKIKSGQYQCLKPIIDTKTSIWYLNGRFGDHPQGYHPIILPKDHPFVSLLVKDIHSRSHCGVTATAAKVKNEYHVLKIKTLARQIRKDCTMCRKVAKALIKVPMAPYPLERFRPAFAFEYSSCDLFGPHLLQVPGRVTRGRPMEYYGKGYGLIFTCLSCRAIHIEAMEGQDTSAFLICLRRFMSIRGSPRSIWSDNGAQIVAADQELRDIVKGWDETKIREYGAHNGIKFEFCAPRAPWQNGVTEALIRSVKNSISQTFASKPRLPIMNLQTVFYETAAVLNERPINLGHDEVPSD
ncbi:MAG: integrase, partial [Nitrosomonadaceae bacterium]